MDRDLALKLNECHSRKEFIKVASLGLGEERLDMVSYLVRKHGEDKIWRMIFDTTFIEINGGMLTKDGSRRRSPGGVLAVLVKNYC